MPEGKNRARAGLRDRQAFTWRGAWIQFGSSQAPTKAVEKTHSHREQAMGGSRPCEPKDFVDYLLRNELTHFEGSPSTRARQEQRQQKLIHRLELLQARCEGNWLHY